MLKKQFGDDEWPIILMNNLTQEMKSLFSDLVTLVKNVAKEIVPKAIKSI